MARPLTPNEMDIIQWLLDNPGPNELPHLPLSELTGLAVTNGCDCGCGCVYFTDDPGGEHIIRDAVAKFSDGRQCMVLLWGCEDRITSLEFIGGDAEVPHRLPEPAELRTWEMLGEEMLKSSKRVQPQT